MNFSQMLLNNGSYNNQQILRTDTVRMMTSNHLSSDQLPISFGLDLKYSDYFLEGYGYGLGVRVKMEDNTMVTPGSFGWSGGDVIIHWIDPKEEIVVVYMHKSGSMFQTPLLKDFEDIIYEILTR